jgi:hypothetical protein
VSKVLYYNESFFIIILNILVLFIFTFKSYSLEYWQFLETRVKIEQDKVDLIPESFRFISGVRFDQRYPGLGVANFRMGPLFKVNDNLFLGISTICLW